MIKNYFKTAFRQLWRNKFRSLLTMLGLAIGISAALVISLIVYYEFSFDTFLPDKERIYRVVIDANFNGVEGHSVGVPAPLGNAIPTELTGVERTVPVFQFQGDATAQVRVEGDQSSEPRTFKKQRQVVFTNNDYFQLLAYDWIGGEPSATVGQPYTVVLTESRAGLYFPTLSPIEVIGKQLTYNDLTVTVSGIVRDLDKPTDFSGKEFISLATIDASPLKDNFMMDVWNDWMAYSQLYIKLEADHTAAAIQTQLNTLYRSHNTASGKDITLTLQPLWDIHFNPHYPSVGGRIAEKSTLYGLLTAAAFLLLLGCINFINLTTAQASQRAKEIGIRKTLGSSKTQLIQQFLGETVLITSIATVFSILLVPLILHLFATHIPPGLGADFMGQPGYLVLLSLLVLTVGFLSGCYPALVLSRYRPTETLKNQVSSRTGQSRQATIRQTLTVSQFTVAQFFILATFIVTQQINYSLDADMGFDKEAVIKFDTPRDQEQKRTALLHTIQSLSGVELASSGFLAPADQGMSFTNVSYHNGKEELKPTTQIRWGDENYLNVYRIELLAGRNVLPGDSTKELLVNEQFTKAIGFQRPEEALGVSLNWNGRTVPIVGVMKDFHHQSTRALISPLLFERNSGSTFHVRLKPNRDGQSWSDALTQIQKAYGQAFPGEEFNYQFVDEMVAQFYEREQATAGLLAWAMSLSILISCLGLLGLAMYTVNARTKEIGIRKVLGATVTSIVRLLSKDVVKLVLIAIVIASPIAWWAMNQWLEDFAYRIEIQWWMFVGAGLAAVVIALLTVGGQAIRAAMANPVDSLRDE
ncbi:ABC transporter permease [Parapedobacter koreensis]|uniref:ABC-type antimicrobial peptide transport system, permease component n=1 Tax=Parapedobacter koreensis TaxID=332977 RepID=A0A1H7R0S4_9SPHI|nr:ABC transporter permease [Parapedobacter koreensis]SEL53850.1 ABC-type antimicrobial peptide transport system, permease component [Parapedobacter koreensis]